MKIALIGYGKMGRTIEEVAIERNHEIVARFGSDGIDAVQLKKADVAIEFTRPEAAVSNISECFNNNIPVVVGTTGWLAYYDEVSRLCREKNGALLSASNFSLGVNIFFAINKKLAAIMDNFPEYNVGIEEIHHTQKLDAPSGTAITLAEQIEDELQAKSGWTMDEKHHKEQIRIIARREADVKGTHIVEYKSEIDSIEIKHTAFTRKGFALGAVMAAEFLKGKQGIFNMQDVLNL